MSEAINNLRKTFIISKASRERFLPLHHPSSGGLRESGMLLAGISELSPPYEVGRLRPNYHVVLATLQGKGVLISEQGKNLLSPGSVAVLPAQTSYRYTISGKKWKILWFHLADTAPWAAVADQGLQVRRWHWIRPLETVMEGFLTEAMQVSQWGAQGSEYFAQLIALYLKREFAPTEDPRTLEMRRRLNALWNSVRSDLRRPWQVRDLAKAFHASPVHLHRLAVKYGGVRPKEMVTRLRMQEACELLRGHDLSVQQVAERIGYENAFAFSTAFRRHTKLSPRAFREQCIQK